MALPIHIDDREAQKFVEVSTGVSASRLVASDGSALLKNAQLPTSLGQKAMTGSVSVALASDQSDVPLNPFGNTASIPPCAMFYVAMKVSADSSPTDVFTLVGPSSGTTYVVGVNVSGTANSAINVPISLIKRSAANTGGTSSSTAAVPAVPGDTTTTALTGYTVNPTGLGTAVGTIHSQIVLLGLASSSTRRTNFIWEANDFNRPIKLAATTDMLCINEAGTAVGPHSITCTFKFFHVA